MPTVGSPDWCAQVIEEFRTSRDDEVEAIAALATSLSQSGQTLPSDHNYRDLASTGGPSSLTTIICPLIAAASGYLIPKVGVPGRPAGAIDSFGSIPGYAVDLHRRQFEQVLSSAGFANSLPGAFAPADAQLFAVRQALNAQAVPGLVIASLLAKKLAVGLEVVAIEIRVMRFGNFGTTAPQARANAELLGKVAARLGMQALVFITYMEGPCQPFIGRLEALQALIAVVDGAAEPWLLEHVVYCRELCAAFAPATEFSDPTDRLRTVLDAHLKAQGVNGLDVLRRHVDSRVRADCSVEVRARTTGYVDWDLLPIREALTRLQARSRPKVGAQYADPAGVKLAVRPGLPIEEGEAIAFARAERPEDLENLKQAILDAAHISQICTSGMTS